MYQLAVNKERDSVMIYQKDFDSDGVMHPRVIANLSIPVWSFSTAVLLALVLGVGTLYAQGVQENRQDRPSIIQTVSPAHALIPLNSRFDIKGGWGMSGQAVGRPRYAQNRFLVPPK